jgi:hypothetical protein
VHLARNRAWRARHPGYWRKPPHGPKKKTRVYPLRSPIDLSDEAMGNVFGPMIATAFSVQQLGKRGSLGGKQRLRKNEVVLKVAGGGLDRECRIERRELGDHWPHTAAQGFGEDTPKLQGFFLLHLKWRGSRSGRSPNWDRLLFCWRCRLRHFFWLGEKYMRTHRA